MIRELFIRTNTDFLTEDSFFADSDPERYVSGLAAWMHGRSLGWRGLTPMVIRSHGARLLEAFDVMVQAMAGREFDVVAVMRGYSGRMHTDFCLGPGSDQVARAADVLSGINVTFMDSSFSLPAWLPLPRIRRRNQADAELETILRAFIDERRTSPNPEPCDLLDLLLAEAVTPLTDEQVRYLIRVTLAASFGSPGAAMAWIVYELATRPAVRECIRAEAEKLRVRTGALIDDTELPFSTAFVREVLRLYPPTWLMGRKVLRKCDLGSWRLYPGQRVMFSPYIVQRDPRWWVEPDELRPDRWLDCTSSQATSLTYFPFGAGPRVCLGIQLGIYQLVTATAHLALNHDIDLCESDGTLVPQALLLPRRLRARISSR
jgi:cytochrome P450